ncbi:Fe-S cluster assembly protein SufD [Leptolyngbya sp. AN02str]|uniref:Fe-S cluster assembly protein SufD n=1 Tax=Leptolyngbya sp. AN02str TaxID=3423363 RepID=UPI003D31057E
MTIQISPVMLEPTTSNAAMKRSAYVQRLRMLAQSCSAGVQGLESLRSRALSLVIEQSFPTTRDEEWRFTDLSPLLDLELTVPTDMSVSLDAIAPWILPEAESSRLVFVNGVYAADLSATTGLAGVTVAPLSQLSEASAVIDRYLAQQPGGEELFTALNTAGLTDAAVVLVSQHAAIAHPIHVLFISTGEQTLAQPRCLVVADPNSAATVIEEFVSLSGDRAFTNSVTEVWLGENAQVNHTRIQREANTSIHIGKTVVSQARDSRYTCNAISLGGAIARHNLEIHQTGENTETVLNGLSVVRGNQLSDMHSAIALSKPHGRTNQIHKTIADDRGHVVFNGKVFVPQLAQQTDAAQLNRNLLLSSKARVDTKPQLEIVADNVKCTHGATVGQLDADEVFYLQSRGIDADSARKLLVYAFAYEIVEKIPVASLQETLTQLINTPNA